MSLRIFVNLERIIIHHKGLFIDQCLDLLKHLLMKTVLQYHPNAPKL